MRYLWLALPACAPEREPPSEEGLARIEWSGEMSLEGAVEIAADEAVFVSPGTLVDIAPGTRLVIEGSLTVMGQREERVSFSATEGWEGIELRGALQGNYLWMSGTGGALRVIEGSLTLTDSFINLIDRSLSPDCLSVSGGEVALDHVYVTGCRGPLLVEQATSVTVTGSSLEGAPVPVRLAQTDAVLTGNNFLGAPGIQDVGGGIAAEVGGNCWGGGEPAVETDDLSQFAGLHDWSEAFVPDTGPR
jgi:hypothetical protein